MSMSNGDAQPEPRVLEVTQVTSLVFYIAPFVLVLVAYDIKSGLGQLPLPVLQEIAKDYWAEKMFKGCVACIIAFNAFRYYWSAFLVESFDSFHTIRAALGIAAQNIEWLLRMSCMIILYIVPFTLAHKARYFELFLIALFALLFFWDLIMYYGPSHGPHNGEFKKIVLIWLRIELGGLVASFLYLLTVWLLASSSVLGALIAVGVLTAVFVFLGVADFYLHWDHYFTSLKRLAGSTVLATLLAVALLKLLGD
jgi:hypothetical protein